MKNVNETSLTFSLGSPSSTINIVFAALYAAIVTVGFIGNCLVIAVVRRNKPMQTTTNCLLVNLAAGDIITLIWCPRLYSVSLTGIHPQGLLGDYVCKIFTGNAVIGVAVASSVLTLTILAVERYHALIKPMKTKFLLKQKDVRKVIGIVWTLSLLINIPDFLANNYSKVYKKCVCPFSLETVKRNEVHVICTVIFLGLFPFLIISFCYLQIMKGIYYSNTIMSKEAGVRDDMRSRKKLARLLLSVTVAFYLCYLPYGNFWLAMVLVKESTIVFSQTELAVVLKVVEFLMVCSSSMNPILYAFQSSNYRKGFKKIFTIQPFRKSNVFASKAKRVSVRPSKIATF